MDRILRRMRRDWRRRLVGQDGMSTAEYAVGTVAAVAFAGVLLKVVTSGTVQEALSGIITRALS
ncbi:MAG: DUF4244 domain-containing protein [Stackebrandtia sp.]